MPTLTVLYGPEEKSIQVEANSLLGEGIQKTGFPIEQPCAGRGTCGKCKVLVEAGSLPPDEIEQAQLTPGEIAINNRLACRARVVEDTRVILTPIVVYSNKIFKSSTAYRRSEDPLGLAIDFGSTTVAAFLTNLNTGEVYTGGATLNQQSTFGADVISRVGAAMNSAENAERLHKLAIASINQAVDSINLGKRFAKRVERVTIVGNVAMHHLISRQPVDTLGRMPFQPHDSAAIKDANELMEGIFPPEVSVTMPPLIGGFVGSDALACLAYFDFDSPPGPLAAIDLGTNGEVMVTDGDQILTASTAAGPAFEGVNISCGSRAIDGAVVDCRIENENFVYTTIGDAEPIGLTGSGLLTVVNALVQQGVIQINGRIEKNPPIMKDRITTGPNGGPAVRLDDKGEILLTQWDIRELQKAKGAIRAAVETLMHQLNLKPDDLHKMILTGSFGGQVDIDAVTALGMIPNVAPKVVETTANGAGFGAAMFLTDEGFALGERLAAKAQQIDLDQNEGFINLYVEAMAFERKTLG